MYAVLEDHLEVIKVLMKCEHLNLGETNKVRCFWIIKTLHVVLKLFSFFPVIILQMFWFWFLFYCRSSKMCSI